MMFMYAILFITLLLVFLIIKLTFLKRNLSDTPAGAVVMGCGIFINGAMKNIEFLDKNAGKISTIVLFLIWIFIAASYIKSAINGTMKNMHLADPIKSFGIGTWVAGTSVCGVSLHERLPEVAFLAKLMFWGNLPLWIFFMVISIRNYNRIYRNSFVNKVHGIILLPAVSTQSIVIFGNIIFKWSFSNIISKALILLGVIFYITGFTLIIKRFFVNRRWRIEEDWLNTNCILHGAISITGLAAILSRTVNYNIIIFIWTWVIIWFLIVESIELLRGLKRIKKFGFKKGIVVYDVTQWVRLFTFGMLYTVTMKLDLKLSILTTPIFFTIRNNILRYGKWIILVLIVVEGILFFKDETVSKRKIKVQR